LPRYPRHHFIRRAALRQAAGSKTVAQHRQSKQRKGGFLSRFIKDERGNTFFLVAAATLPLIGIVGSAVDIGRGYMADLRLQQACDAGVLAGRRAMTGGTYSTAAKAEATKMFNINYDTGTYGSTSITFNSVQDGPSNVKGTATATLPTALMKMFGQTEFNLSVDCTAKLEISNVDVMLVLDVTGSMGSTNSGDSITRMAALKIAVMNFFDTLTGAAIGDGRLRFGVVPYNNNVNVGGILMAANPAWVTNDITLPSRTPIFSTTWGTGVTTYGSPFDGPITAGSWNNNGGTINGKDSTTCPQTTLADDPPVSTSGITQVQTGQYVDGDGNLVTTYDRKQDFRFYSYRYVWTNSNKCQRQRSANTFVRTTPSTVVQPPVPVFSKYKYEDRVFDVTNIKAGGSITHNTGTNGANVTTGWSGCIIERQTVPFASNVNTPPAAFDMDIDMVPNADADTQWVMQLGKLVHPRSGMGPVTTADDYGALGDGRCPTAAMKLTTMTLADRSTFNAYIQSLTPNSSTYHDAGMIWGSRLISPTGIFQSENSTAPNGRPIQRHLIFMTDGNISTDHDRLGFQGFEPTMHRIGQNGDDNEGNRRHNNRFLQTCASIKTKSVTVWAVDFDGGLSPSLVTCASGSDKAFLATNAATLNTQFQAIAAQISKLRISQ
jgi:Flp pilus assembly protein TadG